MKFEQLLKIYWARGFLYGGNSEKYDVSFYDFFAQKKGLNLLSKHKFIRRFELLTMQKYKRNFLTLDLDFRKVINMYLSQLTSINHPMDELVRYNIIRLYLIKTFRGRCLALGKPSRGQRTWSNAWTASRSNSVLKKFISDVKKFNSIVKKVESLNQKYIKKKIKQKAPKIKMIFTKKRTNFWF
jgi:ribosomal protein S13